MTAVRFPSVAWFQQLADAMAAAPDRYRRLGPLDMTLVPRILFPDGHEELYVLPFRGYTCGPISQAERPEQVRAHHPVLIEGEWAAWREMVESILAHGRADLTHTLNYLTLPDWPLRIVPIDEAQGQLDADRFYRYQESLQAFFDEAAAVDTQLAA